MNYLAHVLLCGPAPEAITGALLGDFVKGRLDGRFAPAVAAAIAQHRAIDRYTDGHVCVRESRRLVSAARRRFAPILVDVFYDHFLARHWSRFCRTPLADYTRHVYAVLLAQRHTFPERLQRLLPPMCRDDWLGSYGELRAVEAALNGIARRFARPERARALAGAVEELVREYARFEQHFLEFFPQLMRMAQADHAGLDAG